MAAAPAAWTSRVGFAFHAVAVALVLGGAWLVIGSHIGWAFDRCLAVEGSVWADECRLVIKHLSAVAVVSLLLILWLWRQEAQAEAAGGAEDALPDPELERLTMVLERLRSLHDSDSKAMRIIFLILAYCVVLMVVGVLFRCAGAWLGMQSVADKGAAALGDFGSILWDVGFYSFGVELCCLMIPYMMLMSRRVNRLIKAGESYGMGSLSA